MFCIFFAAFLASVKARDVGMRAAPGVRDSIVNLGKMDVSFYINGKPEDLLQKHFPETSDVIKPCSCSHSDDRFRFFDNLMGHGSHYQPALSTKCCKPRSIHEDIIFTLTPKIHPRHSNYPQDIPFPLNLLIDPSKLKIPSVPKRNKAIEGDLFPKRKDVETNVKTTQNMKTSNKETKFVTDEEKNFEELDLVSPVPLVQNNIDENTEKVNHNTTKNKVVIFDTNNMMPM